MDKFLKHYWDPTFLILSYSEFLLRMNYLKCLKWKIVLLTKSLAPGDDEEAGQVRAGDGGEQGAAEDRPGGPDHRVLPQHPAQAPPRRDCQDQVEQEGQRGRELGTLVGDARQGKSSF